jgi:hypothetical protein
MASVDGRQKLNSCEKNPSLSANLRSRPAADAQPLAGQQANDFRPPARTRPGPSSDRAALLAMTTVDAWFESLERRHLANLTRAELTRALRALSSCYVERREQLPAGAALAGAGKRSAFALFYGALHFLTIDALVRALSAHDHPIAHLTDLGCGTGVGAAAWARAHANPPSIAGVDRDRWAVQEANWTYREFGLRGRAKTGDVLRNYPANRSPASGILLAYTVNELSTAARSMLLDRIADSMSDGISILIVESIARRDKAWWPEWTDRLLAVGARADEWRFPAALPAGLRLIAKSAGLNVRELTARSICRLS